MNGETDQEKSMESTEIIDANREGRRLTMYRRPTMPAPKNASTGNPTREQFEKETGQNLIAFLEKECVGLGRHGAANKINAVFPALSFRMRHSVLYYIVKSAQRTGETKFNFLGTRQRRERPSTPRSPRIQLPVEEMATEVNEPDMVEVTFRCQTPSCGNVITKFISESDLMDADSWVAMGESCALCDANRTLVNLTFVAEFKIRGKTHRRRVIITDAGPSDSFVDDDDNPIGNPFAPRPEKLEVIDI